MGKTIRNNGKEFCPWRSIRNYLHEILEYLMEKIFYLTLSRIFGCVLARNSLMTDLRLLLSDADVHPQHADALGGAVGGDDMQHGLDGEEVGEV